MTTHNSAVRTPYSRRVMVGTGAHKLIIPYNHWLWTEINGGRTKGTQVSMHLDGNVTVYGAMTTFGEVTMKTTFRTNDTYIARASYR